MSESRYGTSRYLALERRIRGGTGRSLPGSLLPASRPPGSRLPGNGDPDGWTGTAGRLRAHEEPDTGVAGATSTASVVRAFDDGAPIELRYDPITRAAHPPAGRQDGRAPAGARPAASVSPAGATEPELRAGPVPVTRAATAPAAPSVADLAAVDDDDDFTARLRDLVENGGAPTSAAPPSAPPAASPAPPPSAPPAASPAPPPSATPPPAAAAETPAEADRYGVFDRIGEALSSPRTFDLGSVPVTAAFDAIERAMDRTEHGRSGRTTPPPSPALDDVDLVEDLALLPTTLAAPAPAWIGYTPGSPDTLWMGQRELPSPAGVPVRNWAAPGVAQFASRKTRALSDVRQIVVHETVSDAWRGIQDPDLGVQLHLDRDGTLVQHNDLLDLVWHVRTYSPHSVGIEVVNLVFDQDVQPGRGEREPGDRIPITWGGKHGGYYVVPPARQMEALAQTVATLRDALAVPDNWLQVMPHPDPARAAGDLAGHTFFLLGTAGHQYFTTATADPWIASHSVLRDHEDGAFPTLYCYLRLHRGMAPADAYQKAREVVEDPGGFRRQIHHDKGTKAQLQLLDITDVA